MDRLWTYSFTTAGNTQEKMDLLENQRQTPIMAGFAHGLSLSLSLSLSFSLSFFLSLSLYLCVCVCVCVYPPHTDKPAPGMQCALNTGAARLHTHTTERADVCLTCTRVRAREHRPAAQPHPCASVWRRPAGHEYAGPRHRCLHLSVETW